MDGIIPGDTPIAADLTALTSDTTCWRPALLGRPSDWYAHVPFAFWIVAQVRPRVLVDFGDPDGVSYATFCQAVAQGGLGTRCCAVDPRSHGAPAGIGLGAAAATFADASVDLLHIGQHDDNAADMAGFAAWTAKLSDRAVVLFDATNPDPSRPGCTALWDALRTRYPGFVFSHGGGLGMLAVGTAVVPAIAALCALRDPVEIAHARGRFVAVGEHWAAENHSILQRGRTVAPTPPESDVIANAAGVAPGIDAGPAAAARLSISVIIPLYNGAPFIAAALDSVLAQTLPPAEIIVVDDGSTDDGPAIVARMAKQHPITLLHKVNGGQSSARNVGVAYSVGTHIALLDQDDIWYPEHLEELSRPFLEQAERDLGWVYSNLDEIEEDGSMRVRACLRLSSSTHPKRDLWECLRYDMFVLPSASLIARVAFDAVGGFDESLSGYEDDDLFLRLFRAGYACAYVDQPLSKWRVYLTSASFSPRMARSRMIYFRKLITQFPNVPRRHLYYVRDFLAPRFLSPTIHDYSEALRCKNYPETGVAAASLALVVRQHNVRVRFVFALLMPLLRMPRLARLFLPLADALRPLLRVALR